MSVLGLSEVIAAGRGGVTVGALRITLRSEERRGNDYWYAYRKVGGKTKKVYVGPLLTEGELTKAAAALSDPAPQADEVAVTQHVTQQDGTAAADSELAAMRLELARVTAERDALAGRLAVAATIAAKYEGGIVRQSNGKISPRWDKAVSLLDDLASPLAHKQS